MDVVEPMMVVPLTWIVQMTEYRTKILFLDIETAPISAYVWGLWDQNVGLNQIIEPGRIICFTAQWYGSKTVIFKSEYHDGYDLMLAELHTLMDEADVVSGWNSDAFDIPWIEGEFQAAGLLPPSPYHKLDLMKHFRKHSRYPSRKLAYVSDRLLEQTKVTHEGFQMWRDCIEEDVDPEVKRKAWAKMKRYAIRDTALLPKIYDAVKGWVKLPVPMVIDPGAVRCRCGSPNIEYRGYSRTQASVYRRFQCKEPTCGAWGRVAKRDADTGGGRQV